MIFMQTTISSEKLTAVIDSFGAELHSLRDSCGTERLWQADPKVWKRHAPVLFPFICNTASKKYTYDGKTYSLSNHGFARDSEFEAVKTDERSAEFLLKSSENSREQYPFDFELYIKYTVSGNRLNVGYTVKNTDSKEMYFFIGGHPAFNVPDFDEWEVRYEKAEKIIRDETVIADNSDTVPLSHELFADDVFMKDAPASSWVALVNKKNGSAVKLRYDNKGCIAVWSSYFQDKELTKQAKFVCLEPWSSVPVYCDNEEELTKMKHAIRLAPGDSYDFAYSIEVE